jgi:ABC-type lipoprotein release transport system permease subunit
MPSGPMTPYRRGVMVGLHSEAHGHRRILVDLLVAAVPVLVVGALAGVVAAIRPARRAARLDVVAALAT